MHRGAEKETAIVELSQLSRGGLPSRRRRMIEAGREQRRSLAWRLPLLLLLLLPLPLPLPLLVSAL